MRAAIGDIQMGSKALRLLKWLLVAGVASLVTLLGVRAWQSQQGPQLELWHVFEPREMTAAEIAKADWPAYLVEEQRIFDEVRTEVTDKLPPEAQFDANRYYAKSPIYPGSFRTDWNRSYVMEPAGKPLGAVVLLHGLTDSPYSLRHVALRYQADGFVTVAVRLPGHGTVPGGLAAVEWEQWMEATRLAAREARRRAGPGTPLHVVGFSNGGALAMKYAMDAIDDKALPRPDRIVLLSPMIGVTSLARFAGVFGWPAVLPRFAKAAWLGVVTEFNPFKFNSFPVNGARQSSLVARSLQERIDTFARDGRLAEIAPVLTFQSVVDFTVSTRAIVNALYDQLPRNGSELVLFDFNRNAKFGPLLRRSTETLLERMVPPPPRNYRLTVVVNETPSTDRVVERTTEPGAAEERSRLLDLLYPRDVFSLSHVALPFPMDDSLYGLEPTTMDYGVNLGALATRGERGLLTVSLDSLVRMSANPFFPYMMKRIEESLPSARPAAAKP